METIPPFQRLETALIKTVEVDRDLFRRDVNERSITHRLGLHLTPLFPTWNIDCEYNREGHDSKRIVGKPTSIKSSDTEGQTVYPDIIVHRRGTNENLLVVEAKKLPSNTQESDSDILDSDILKLNRFVSGALEYCYAAAILFHIDAPSDSKIKWTKEA